MCAPWGSGPRGRSLSSGSYLGTALRAPWQCNLFPLAEYIPVSSPERAGDFGLHLELLLCLLEARTLSLPLTSSLKHLVPEPTAAPLPSALSRSSGGEPTRSGPRPQAVATPVHQMALQARCRAAAGQPGPFGAGAYLGPRAAAGSSPETGPQGQGWTQAAGGIEALRAPEGNSRQRMQTRQDGIARGSGWGGRLLPFSWGPPCRASFPPAKPHLQTPPSPPRPGPAAPLCAALEPSRSPP